jgi:serine/threonine protein kinase
MSPEQTDPRAGISPATDVWALGLIVYWLLTGRPYWIAAADPSCSMHAVMREILFDPMAPASARAGERGAAERLPPGFDAWFERCVAREPKARFATATELLASFEQLCNGFDADAIGPPASIAGSLAHDSTAPLSTRSYLAAAGRRDDPPAPTGSAFVSPSPDAAEASHRDGLTVTRAASTRRNMILGAGIGLLAAAAAVVLVPGLGTPSPAHPRSPEESTPTSTTSAGPVTVEPRSSTDIVILSATASANPMPSAEVIPSASSVTSLAPVPKASAERLSASARSSARAEPGPGEASDAGSAESPTEALPPFDLRAATSVVKARLSGIAHLCKIRQGPRAVGATLHFDGKTGSVTLIDVHSGAKDTGTGFCVYGHLLATKITPFSGEGQGVPVSVALD